jgi:hypothetical protein
MEGGVMEEGTGKAIPLRRPRSGARVVPARRPRSWSLGVGAVRTALEPPRQVWLAGLGSGALAWRGARAAWQRLVAEGTEVEGALRRVLGRPTPTA